MTELDSLFRRPGVEGQRDAQAEEAVRAFRSMQPTLTAYARMLTRRKDVRVEMSNTDNGSTDGTRIFYRPPMALGDRTPHRRSVCDKRDDNGDLVCKACFKREDVLVTIYHEIGHQCFDTFAPISDFDKIESIKAAIKEHGGKYAKQIEERISNLPFREANSYMALAGKISPFLPLLWNALEDARVNARMHEARKGTRKMFEASVKRVFREGVEQRDPDTGKIVKIMWSEYPQNMQATIGTFCVASGYDFTGWFIPPVDAALRDEELNKILKQMDTIRTASGVYHLSFKVLARLRELGFLKSDTDPEEEESEEDAETEAADDRAPDRLGDGEGDPPEEPDADSAPGTEGSEKGDPGAAGEPGSDSGDDGEADDDAEDSSDEGDGTGGGGDDLDLDSDVDGDSDGTGEQEAGDSEGSESGGDGDEMESSDVPDAGGDDMADEAGPDSPSDSGEPGDSEAGDSEAGGGEPVDGDSGNVPGEAGDEGSDESSSDLDSGGGSWDRGAEGTDDTAPADEVESSAGEGDIDEPTSEEGNGGESSTQSGDGQVGDFDSSVDTSRDDPDDSDDREGAAEAEIGSSSEDSEGHGDSDTADSGQWETPTEAPAPSDEIDTGADRGLGGTELIEDSSYDDVPMGTPEEVERGMKQISSHDDPPRTAHEKKQEDLDNAAIDLAVIQGMYFETPSRNVLGVNEYRHGDLNAQGWDRTNYSWMSDDDAGVTGNFTPQESVLGKALMKMRVVFAENARGREMRNLKSGRVNTRVLGLRAHRGDDRLFQKRRLPGKRKYFVLIGIDISGSTQGVNLKLAKRAALAQAELCHRMGIDFAVYAHTSKAERGKNWTTRCTNLEIFIVKDPNEPWTPTVAEHLADLKSCSGNLDGHTLEYYRKCLDKHDATDKILLYYTDGKMPAENHDEELEILQREIEVCKRKRYTLLGVGIRTDSPRRHGLDTVQVETDEDIIRVVEHLEKVLIRSSGR